MSIDHLSTEYTLTMVKSSELKKHRTYSRMGEQIRELSNSLEGIYNIPDDRASPRTL